MVDGHLPDCYHRWRERREARAALWRRVAAWIAGASLAVTWIVIWEIHR